MTKNLDSTGLRSIVEHYDLFFVDLWGVVHNGIKLNKNAKKFFITNIGEDYETPSFTASDYIVNAYQYINSIENKKLNINIMCNIFFILIT